MRILWVQFNLFLSVTIIGIMIMFIGIFDQEKKITGRLARLWAEWMLFVCGISYTVTGLENLKLDNQFIFMSNHESALDILIGLAALPFNIVFLAKKELFRIPIFGWAMHSAGTVLVDRQNRENAQQSVNNALAQIKKSKTSILMYPEGTRSQNGELLTFKKGGFILAIRSKLPIVPVTILGTHNALPKWSLKIRDANIQLIIGEAILTEKMTEKNRDQLLANCRKVIENNKIQAQAAPQS